MKYYAVRKGYEPGIYESWGECQAQVIGYPGAVFKSFESIEAAKNYISLQAQEQLINPELPYAYVDGTYSKKKAIYGYGGFICNAGQYHIIQGTGNNPDYLQERNIAGELLGTIQAAFICLRLGIHEINLYFDYEGIEQYVTGDWKAGTKLAQYYRNTIELIQNEVKIHFVKVKGHTGVEGNELADYLAKEIIGAKLREKDIAALESFRAATAQT